MLLLCLCRQRSWPGGIPCPRGRDRHRHFVRHTQGDQARVWAPCPITTYSTVASHSTLHIRCAHLALAFSLDGALQLLRATRHALDAAHDACQGATGGNTGRDWAVGLRAAGGPQVLLYDGLHSGIPSFRGFNPSTWNSFRLFTSSARARTARKSTHTHRNRALSGAAPWKEMRGAAPCALLCAGRAGVPAGARAHRRPPLPSTAQNARRSPPRCAARARTPSARTPGGRLTEATAVLPWSLFV